MFDDPNADAPHSPSGAGGPDVGTGQAIEDAEVVEPQDPIDPDDVPESAPPSAMFDGPVGFPGTVLEPRTKEPQPLPPAEPPTLVLTPKPKAPSVKGLHEVLEAIEHPMTPESVKKWDKAQKRAAWNWAWAFREWFEANEAKHPLADKGCDLPRPSFLPEYGNVQPLGPQTPQAAAGDDFGEGGPCGAVLDLTGAVCGLVGGHAGGHEPA